MKSNSTSNDKSNLTIHGIDMRSVSFNFVTVLHDKEMRALFKAYLATEYNTEPLLFLEEIFKLEAMFNIKHDQHDHSEQPTNNTVISAESVKLALDICKRFICSNFDSINAPVELEINISSEAKAKVIECMRNNDQYKNETSWVSSIVAFPYQVFTNIKDSIKLELQCESFPRYVIFCWSSCKVCVK